MDASGAYWSMLELSDALRRRRVSALEVTSTILDRITRLEPICKSYVSVLGERALAQARQADDEMARGFSRGPLHGVPIAFKDLCFTKGIPTTAGMAIYKDWLPDFDATVVERLNRAGAINLGKLKMTEGATLFHHPTVAPPRNPWNPDYWPGVSSSGSGVAVAAGLCYGSLGSDTGASIRFPAACCGITGLKPTWGRVSRYGIFPCAESLDHIGPMARSVADVAALLSVIAGEDPRDATSLDAPVPDYLAALGENIRGLRIGIDRRYADTHVDEEVVSALDGMERVLVTLGARMREVNFPAIKGIVGSSMSTISVEMSDAHRDTYPGRAGEYGRQLAGMLEAGTHVTALDVVRAERDRRNFCGSVNRLWKDIDVLFLPILATTVPTVAALEGADTDTEIMAKNILFALPFNVTGNPTLVVPCGFSKNGLPIGAQLVGPHLSEGLLCRVGHAFQQTTDWHTRHPDL